MACRNWGIEAWSKRIRPIKSGREGFLSRFDDGVRVYVWWDDGARDEYGVLPEELELVTPPGVSGRSDR